MQAPPATPNLAKAQRRVRSTLYVHLYVVMAVSVAAFVIDNPKVPEWADVFALPGLLLMLLSPVLTTLFPVLVLILIGGPCNPLFGKQVIYSLIAEALLWCMQVHAIVTVCTCG